jgi:hypothetical protein
MLLRASFSDIHKINFVQSIKKERKKQMLGMYRSLVYETSQIIISQTLIPIFVYKSSSSLFKIIVQQGF